MVKGGFFRIKAHQTVKNLPAIQKIRVRSLGGEDPLEKGMATHSSILGWRIPWTEEPGELQSMGSPRVRHDWTTNTFNFIAFCFIMLSRYWMFYKSKICGNLVSSKSINTTFSNRICLLLVSVSHFAVFQNFHQQKDDNSQKAQMTVNIF